MIERLWVQVPAGSAFCAGSSFGIRSIKDPNHSVKSAGGRLQLNMHAPYICGFAWSEMVHGCMVYTERAKMAEFQVAPAMSVL